MLKEQARLLNKITVIVDLSLVALSFVVAFYFRREFLNGKVDEIREYSWLLVPAIPVWYYFLTKYSLYKSIRQINFVELFYRIFCANLFSGFVVSALVLFIDRDYYSRQLLLTFVATAFLFILLERLCLKIFLSLIRRRGMNYRELLIVGTTERAQKFIELVENHTGWGLRIKGVLQVASGALKEDVSGYKVLGRIEGIVETCKQHSVDEVVFCLSKDQVVNIEKTLQDLEELGVTVRMVLDFYNLDRYKKDLSFFENDIPILTFHTKSLDTQQYFLKRILDISGSFVGLIVLTLMTPVIALGIKIGSPGPVFYSQFRVGENGRPFRILKFRTMSLGADELKHGLENLNEMNGPIFKIKDDPRITSFGRLLRMYSLDELPQFWNVLIGNMSLVGTRPPTIDEVAKYENWHRQRISIKPGLTGLWQVSGRGKVSNFDDVVKLDLQYIDEWNIGLDIRIIFRTIWVVLTAKGSS